MKKSPNLTTLDRCYLGLLALLIPVKRIKRIGIILQPNTLIGFHNALVKCKYRFLFSKKFYKKPGPKGPSAELVKLVVETKEKNIHMGCLQISNLITNNFDFDINEMMVRRILKKHFKPIPGSGPSWLTFLGHSKDSLWSIDFFCCESILLKTHWVMVVMDQYSRQLVGLAVHSGSLDGPIICKMFSQIMRGRRAPKYLSMDHDPLFTFHQWKANLRIYEIKEIKSVPGIPCSHPFIERVIGTIRRDFLDRTLFWNDLDLQLKLEGFAQYYNEVRVHSSIDSIPPMQFTGEVKNIPTTIDRYGWKSHCRGLFTSHVEA